MSDDLIASTVSALTAAGGNSRAARSARAKLQWRDRYGRWVEMGRGVKFKVRFPDGAPRSVVGKFVGAKDPQTGQVYVSKDPNGLPDGFYSVKSDNAQEMIADLSPEQLKSRGISVGQDETGNKVGERMSEAIPNAHEIERTDAPAGWKALPGTYGGKKVIETEDGEFRIHFGGKDGKWVAEDMRGGGGNGTAYSNAGDAFDQVNRSDESRVDLNEDNEAKVAQLGRDELIDAIKLNERTINNDRASIDAKQRAMQQNEQIKGQLSEKGFDAYDPEGEDSDANLARRKADKSRAAADTATPATEAPEGSPAVVEGEADSAPQAEDAGDAAPEAAGAIDTSTFGVEATGFLVPTGKKTNDITPEGLALHIESEMDHYTEGGKRLVIDTDLGEAEGYNSAADFNDAKAQAGGVGVDHVLDLANNKVEQVDAPDNVDNSGTGDGTNDEVRGTDAGESERAESGGSSEADNGVGGEAEPADSAGGEGSGGSGGGDDRPAAADGDDSDDDGPTDPNRRAAGVFRKPDAVKNERADLEGERTRNQDALGRTGNRNVMEQIAKRLGEIETRLAELDQEDRDREDAERAPAPERKPDPRSEDGPNDRDVAYPDGEDDGVTPEDRDAPERFQPKPEEPVEDGVDPWAPVEPGSVEEMKQRRKGLIEALDSATHADDIVALNELIDELDKKIANRTPEEQGEFPDAEPVGDDEDEAAAEQITNDLAGANARAEGDATLFEGLTPDRIAGDAPFVNGQPDFFAEGDAKSALEKIERAVAEGRPPFEDLTPEEQDAFNEATARDAAWVQANNNWSINDAPAWVGPTGETAIQAWGEALNKPTGAEQREAISALYDSMTPQEKDIFLRDRDAALEQGAGADIARVQPDENQIEANRQAAAARLEEARERAAAEALARENNPTWQQLSDAPRGTMLDVNGRKYTSTGDGYWIDHYNGGQVSDRNLWDRYENESMSFTDPDPANANLDMSREEWDRRQARIEELEGKIQTAQDALDSGDFPAEGDEADYWYDSIQDSQDELNELLITTPSEDELQEPDAEPEAPEPDEPTPAPALTEDDVFEDGELPNLDNYSDEELVQVRDILQNMVDEGRAMPDVRELLNRANEQLGEPNRINPNEGFDEPEAANPGDDEARNEAEIFGGIEASELSDGLLRDEILNLEIGEREGVLTADEEGFLAAYRAEMLRRVQANRAVNEALEGIGEDDDNPIADQAEEFLREQEAPAPAPGVENTAEWARDEAAFERIMEDEARDQRIDGRPLFQPGGPFGPEIANEYHVGDILRGPDGTMYEVVAVLDADQVDVDSPKGVQTVNPDAEGFTRVFDREAELNREVFNDPTSTATRLARAINEEEWAEANPEQVGEASQRDALRPSIEGKRLTDNMKASLQAVVDDPATSKHELDKVKEYLDGQPNAANTLTKPRIVVNAVPMDPDLDALAGAQDNPEYNETFDILWEGVTNAFPDALVSPEGDLIIDRIQDFRTPAKRNNQINKDYELRVRRTGNNTAFVYILETDTKTGERKALRLSKETHSWETFAGRLKKAQETFKNPKLHITVSRSENTEHLGKNRDVGENPLREFLEKGVRPSGPDEVFNEIANTVIDKLLAGEKFGKVVDGLRKMDEVDTDAVNRVAQAFIAQMMAPNAAGFRPRDVHISYDGRKVEAGDRFEWTDHRKFLDWYKPTMRPNPDYQKVFRGTVIRLKDEHSDGKGRRYGDDLIIQFDEGQPLAEGGFKNTNWGSLAAQAIRVLDDDSQPLGEPFEAKREELASPEAIAKAFNVPVAKPGQNRNTPVPSRPKPKGMIFRPLGKKKIDPATNTISGYRDIRVPYDRIEAAEMVENGERTNKSAAEMNVGDFYVTQNPTNGEDQLRVILRKNEDGNWVTASLSGSIAGSVEVQAHSPGAFDHLAIVPNWEEPEELPDGIAPGALVEYIGKRWAVEEIGLNRVHLLNGQFPYPVRARFSEVKPLEDSNKEIRNELLERADEMEWSLQDKREITKRLLDPNNTEADFDEIAKWMNTLRPVEGAGIGRLGSLIGALGLPDSVLNRFIESFGLPGSDDLGNKVTISKVQPIDRADLSNIQAMLGDADRYEFTPGEAVLEAAKGDIIVMRDYEGRRAAVTVMSDWKDGEFMKYRLEAVFNPGWNWGQSVGREYGVWPKDGTFSAHYKPTPEELMTRLTVEEEEISSTAKAVAKAIREDYKQLIADFKGGWSVEFVPSNGNIHDIGQIAKPRGGGENFFMKRAQAYEEAFDGENAQKEFLATVVWRALGGKGIKGAYDPETRMYVMNAVNGVMGNDRWDQFQRDMADPFTSEAWRMGLLDKLIFNGDRHAGNLMYGPDGTLYPIDHGNAHFEPSQGMESRFAEQLMLQLREGRAPITSAQLLRLRNELAAMLPFFESFGRRDWYDAVMTNMENVLEASRIGEGKK